MTKVFIAKQSNNETFTAALAKYLYGKHSARLGLKPPPCRT